MLLNMENVEKHRILLDRSVASMLKVLKYQGVKEFHMLARTGSL